MKDKKIDIKGNPVIFVGNFGSGKTEVAVNFCLYMKQNSSDEFAIVDLDIVNPYFRSREARKSLEEKGIEVVSPKADEHYADTPIISPRIKAAIQDGSKRLILDVGGDDLGAKVLSSMYDALGEKSYELLLVLNANRPFTGDEKGCISIIKKIEASSRLKVTGIVSNTHLIDETTEDTVNKGYKLSKAVAKKLGISVQFVCVDVSLRGKINENNYPPILPISRLMLKPWEREVKGRGKGL